MKVQKVEENTSGSGKKYYVYTMENDTRRISGFDYFAAGTEIPDAWVVQKGEYWNIKKPKNAPKPAEVIEVTQLAKSDKELRAMLAEKAAGCASVLGKDEAAFTGWFQLIYLSMHNVVFGPMPEDP